MDSLRQALIRLAAAQPPRSAERKALLATIWKSPPGAEDFKSDPEAGQLYGQYVFWLMHHDGSPAQRNESKKLQRALTSKGFNQWGLAVDNWPDAAKEYLRLTRKHGIEPEAVRRAYETGDRESDGWNPGTVPSSIGWSAGEGSAMPPERDLQGLQVDQKDFTDNHLVKNARLRSEAIRLAVSLPPGSEERRKLLTALFQTR